MAIKFLPCFVNASCTSLLRANYGAMAIPFPDLGKPLIRTLADRSHSFNRLYGQTEV
ncbi:MAG: hypothetical protein QFX34_04755 [Candidatus Verstraetearchaeota archaeon]|nr:hypothetical protein [Candidatus Verstraetearchaeota archaeon]